MQEHEKILKKAVDDPLATDSGIQSVGNFSLKDLYRDQNVDMEADESPFDTESKIKFKFADKIDSLVPQMVADTLEKRLHDRLFDALKNILPQLPNDFVKKLLPKFDKRVKNTLKAKVHERVLKPQNKEFNALNKLESHRDIMVVIAKHLQTKVEKDASNVHEMMELVHDLM
nr:hypothetical protein [Tanacetum cinerariifolium]